MLRKLLPLASLALLASTARADIDPSAPSLSHALEEAAVAIHDYLHDGYPSSFGAHGLEGQAVILHDGLHDWSNGTLPESFIAAYWRNTRDAYRNFRQTIRSAGVLNSGDDGLDQLFSDTVDAFRDLRDALDDVELLIEINAPSLSHQLQEAAEAIHHYLHLNYPSSYGAHGLEDEAVILHDDLHDWAEGLVSEDQIECDFEAVEDAYKNFKKTIRKARILNAGDAALDALFDDVKSKFRDVKRALRRL